MNPKPELSIPDVHQLLYYLIEACQELGRRGVLPVDPDNVRGTIERVKAATGYVGDPSDTELYKLPVVSSDQHHAILSSVIYTLDSMRRADLKATEALFSVRVECRDSALRNHRTIIVSGRDDLQQYFVGVMGVINGIVRELTNGKFAVAKKTDVTSGDLIEFIPVKWDDVKLVVEPDRVFEARIDLDEKEES
jgi:hypothetical protein